MVGEWRFNPSVHRAKGDRLMRARELPVCDNALPEGKKFVPNCLQNVAQITKGKNYITLLILTISFVQKLSSVFMFAAFTWVYFRPDLIISATP